MTHRCIKPACDALGCVGCNCAVPADVYTAISSAVLEDAADELTRLVDRVERLRGLCKSAVCMLRDAGCNEQADEIHALIGDMEDLALDRVPQRCRKCGGAMRPGIATGQTVDCGDEGTCSPGGPGKLIDCLKCKACGWSVTA